MLRAIAVATAVMAGALPAAASDLGRPSEGFVYFHQAGADLASHRAAVRSCLVEASKMLSLYMPSTGGIIGNLVQAPMQNNIQRLHLAANVENCMVSRGWNVMRLDEASGAEIAAMAPEAQAQALSSWIGASAPEGETVRRFEPLGVLQWARAVGPFDKGRQSLSVTASWDEPIAEPRDLSPKLTMKSIKPAARASAVAPGTTVIVVRATGLTGSQQISVAFSPLRPAGEAGEAPIIVAGSPFKAFAKAGNRIEKVYVFEVPPGRWRMVGAGPATLCLGGPGFDVMPGDAVFAGSFNAGAPEAYAPGLDIQSVAPALAGTEIGARLKPATYVNGLTNPCEQFPATYLYAHEVPGAPYLAGGPRPGHAVGIGSGGEAGRGE